MEMKKIQQWNDERDNLDFDRKKEVRMIVEEIYEVLGYKSQDAKDLAKVFVNNSSIYEETNDLIADAFGDIIFIATGSLYKLGYDAEIVMDNIIKANNQKSNKKDKFGKIMKDKTTFVEPNHNNAIVKT